MGNTIKKAAVRLSQLSISDYRISDAISGPVNYLLDSYFSKTDERAALRPRQEWVPGDPDSHIKSIWLDCPLSKAITLSNNYPRFAKALNAWAFHHLFNGSHAQYEIIPFLDQYEFKSAIESSFYWRVQSEQLQIGPDQSATLPVFGQYFIVNKSTGDKLFVHLDLGIESMNHSIKVMANPGNQATVESFFADMNASVKTNDIYYRKCTTYVRGRLEFSSVVFNTWDDVVLKTTIKEQIRNNTLDILSNADTLQSIGMTPNRNVILISPPGMAKTTIFRAISSEIEGQISRIWCTGKSIQEADDVTILFEAARSLAPCIVFIEDMDLFGGDRTGLVSYGSGRVLNEFLACLDGCHDNSGVVILASTNDIASMDEALVNRPGRFDEKIEIPLPDAEDRALMMASFFKRFSALPDDTVTNETWKNVIDMTDRLTGAYLKDLAKSTVVRAVSSGRITDGIVHFNADDFVGAADKIMKNWHIGQKSKKHITADLSKKGTRQ